MNPDKRKAAAAADSTIPRDTTATISSHSKASTVLKTCTRKNSSNDTKFRYHGGKSVRSKEVTAFEYQNFKDFSREILLKPIPIEISKSEYLALDRDQQNQWKDVPYVSPGCYDGSRANRSGKNVSYCNLVCLDIDDSKETRSIVSNPKLLKRKLKGYQFIAYHSASSTEKDPRIRVIVSADKIQKKSYAAAVRYIAEILGVTANKESLNAAQPMYRPTIFKGDNVDPVFAKNLSGRPIDAALLEGTCKVVEEEDPFEILDALTAQKSDYDLLDGAKDLSVLDPDLERGDWISVGMAIRHQFGEEGFRLFHDWSSRGAKFDGYKNTKYIWDSFDENPSRKPITIRTVQRLVKDLVSAQEAAGIVALDDLIENPPVLRPELINGVMRQGEKVLFGGPSKIGKTWAAMQMAIAIATGQPWFGFETVKKSVLILDFEQSEYSFRERAVKIMEALDQKYIPNLHVWSLRGQEFNLTMLLKTIRMHCKENEVGLIVIDPLYSALGEKDENSNSDMSALMREFEHLAQESGASILIVHHFTKSSGSKEAMHNFSGAGALARAPDGIISLSKDGDGARLEFILRDFKPIYFKRLLFEFPLWEEIDHFDEEDPMKVGRPRKYASKDLLDPLVSGPIRYTDWKRTILKSTNMSEATFKILRKVLLEKGVVTQNNNKYSIPLLG